MTERHWKRLKQSRFSSTGANCLQEWSWSTMRKTTRTAPSWRPFRLTARPRQGRTVLLLGEGGGRGLQRAAGELGMVWD